MEAGVGTNIEAAHQAATTCYKQLYESIISRPDTTDDDHEPEATPKE